MRHDESARLARACAEEAATEIVNARLRLLRAARQAESAGLAQSAELRRLAYQTDAWVEELRGLFNNSTIEGDTQ